MERFLVLLLAGLTNGVIYAAVALSLVLIWRSTRVLNFAQGAMAVATTYVAFLVWQATGSVLLAVVAGVCSGALLGAGVERLAIRFVPRAEALNAVLASFGIMVMLTAALGIAFTNEIRPFPPLLSTRLVEVGGVSLLSPQDTFVLLAVLGCLLGLVLLFARTAIGLQLRAAAYEPEVARLLGVNVSRTLTIGWALAGAVGSLAGVLVIPATTGLSPTALDVVFVMGFTAAVIGGLESPVGAVVGGIGIGLIASFTAGYFRSDAIAVITLVILTVVLLLRPGGLFTHTSARRV
jgi:branched-chain amino acid transport system permease protein